MKEPKKGSALQYSFDLFGNVKSLIYVFIGCNLYHLLYLFIHYKSIYLYNTYNTFFKLLGYAGTISTMSGVISPTNLSLYSAPMPVSRPNTRTRWSEDELNAIPHSISSTNIENTQVILMEDCKFIILFK